MNRSPILDRDVWLELNLGSDAWERYSNRAILNRYTLSVCQKPRHFWSMSTEKWQIVSNEVKNGQNIVIGEFLSKASAFKVLFILRDHGAQVDDDVTNASAASGTG